MGSEVFFVIVISKYTTGQYSRLSCGMLLMRITLFLLAVVVMLGRENEGRCGEVGSMFGIRLHGGVSDTKETQIFGDGVNLDFRSVVTMRASPEVQDVGETRRID